MKFVYRKEQRAWKIAQWGIICLVVCKALGSDCRHWKEPGKRREGEQRK